MLLGLDQSSRVTGWCVFDNDYKILEWGKIDVDGEMGNRLCAIRKSIIDLVNKYGITEVAFEEIQLQDNIINNVTTFKCLAEVYGVVLQTIVELGLKYEIVASSSWKSTCKIKGRTRPEQKKNAQLYIEQKYNIKVIQDICDSICIAEHYIHQKSLVYNWD